MKKKNNVSSSERELTNLGKKIGVIFKNADLLKEALTHRSYINENSSWPVSHNERLEYLGDAVLELVVTEYLFKKYQNRQEGELTSFRAALVNYQMLSRVAREIKLGDFIYLSRGESKDAGRAREVILANAFEALVGAIYLDLGYSKVSDFILRFVIPHLDEVIENKLYRDSKSLLQEIVQEKLKITPIYRVLHESGPDHNKKFVVGVFFSEEFVAEGIGASKQEAESSAARTALKTLKAD